MTALIVSQGLLWITVLLMGLVILALARQVGVLHERLAPIGALTTGPGPEIGKPAPRLVVDSMSATKVQIGGKTATGKAQLLFFVSAVCPICKKLIPVSQGFARSEKLDVIFVGDSADAECDEAYEERDRAARLCDAADDAAADVDGLLSEVV